MTTTHRRLYASAFLTIAVVAGSLTGGLTASAQTVSDLTAQMNALLAQVAALQAQLASQTGGSGSISGVPSTFRFDRNLSLGATGTDVRYLQIILNSSADTRVNAIGASGGPGSETTYFGPLTRAAVIKFQNKFRSEILTPIGLTAGTGFVGVSTKAKLNALIAGGVVIVPPPPPPQNATTLTVSASTQPSVSLLPSGAVRVPLLRANLTSSGTSAITVTSMTVNVGGVVQTGAISGIVMIDAEGNQIGLPRIVGSGRQVTFTDPIVMQPGTTRTVTFGVNMNSALSTYQGQTIQLSLVDVKSNAAVQAAALPVIGPSGQINATFPIGTATVYLGSFGLSPISRDIGTTAHIFSSIRITAGSQEDLILRSIRWTQNGSVSASDLSNVATIVDGTAYTATVSDRTYSSTFGSSGVRIPSGQSKEILLRGDISGGVGRTAEFNIENASDINLIGASFNFGMAPTPTATASISSGAEFTTGSPFFSGSVVTITGAAVSVSRAATVSAQNVAPNVANQTLGGFDFEVFGEGVTASQLQLQIGVSRAIGSSASVSDIRSLTLVTSSGSVIAGPTDASGSGTSGTVAWTNLTFPTGRTTLTAKGTLGSSFIDGDVITLSLTPSVNLTGIRGQVSGTVVSAVPTSSVSSHPMTVRAGTVRMSVSPTPVAQTVVAGAQAFTFAQFVIDATSSGEDFRFTSLPVRVTHSGNISSLSSCQLYNAATALTTGGNAISPTASSGSDIVFGFDTALIVTRGAVMTLTLKCNISSSASSGSTFSFGMVTVPSGVGVSSGQTMTPSVTPSTGQTITVAASGTFTVSQDLSTPSYSMAAGGSTVTSGILAFRAGNEAVRIDQVALQLSGTTESSPSDLASVALLDDGGSQVGSAFFGSSRTATAVLSGSSFIIPANSERRLTIRPTFTQIGTGQPGTEGALIRIDYDGDNAAQTRGVGQSSGSTVTSGSASDTSFPGIRLFKTIPTLALLAVPTQTLISGDNVLLRFSINANANGSLGLYKLSLTTTPSSGVTISDVTVSAFSDSMFNSPATGNTGGRLDQTPSTPDSSGNVEIYARNSSGTLTPLQIPAGGARYFEVRATVTGTAGGSSVVTRILGESTYTSFASLVGTAAAVDADSNDNLIWSPNREFQSGVSDSDWTNAFGVSGLPAAGFTQTLSR